MRRMVHQMEETDLSELRKQMRRLKDLVVSQSESQKRREDSGKQGRRTEEMH